MTNPNLTEIVLVLDQSASMEPLAEESRTGVNQFLADQRSVDKPARVTLTTFNSKVEFTHDNVDLKEFEDLSSFPTGGMTALYDAIGMTIDRVGKRLAATSEHERPAQVIFVIVTDGNENASKEYTTSVRDMIKHQQDKYSWDFVFLGANIDVKSHAVRLNIPTANAHAYEATEVGSQMLYSAISRGTRMKRMDPSLSVAEANFKPDLVGKTSS